MTAFIGSPSHARRTLLTVTLGEILIILGLTPVVAVVPGLAAALGVGAAEGAWVLTVFILALAGTLLVSGRLGDLVGHRRVFALGAVVYAAGAAVAGAAPGLGLLLLGRAAQGVGGAMVSGNNLAILTRAVAPSHHGRAIAVVATAASIVAVLGAGLGTAAIALGGWPLLFLGTIPAALWAAVRARRLPGSAAELGPVSVDWAGASLLVLTMTLLAIALNHPHGTTSQAVMEVFHVWLPLLALAAGAACVIVERRVRVPLMDWRQLRDRAFAAAIGVNSVLHLTMMGALYLGPLLVVRGLGLGDTAGGMLTVVVNSSVVGTAFLGGWLFDRTRAAWIRPGATLTLALGFLGWATAALAENYAGVMAAGFVAGLGSGVLLSSNNAVIMASLPGEARGVASGMLETTRHFGHAFGVTIPTAIVALVAASAGPAASQAVILRDGFFWASLAMAGISGLGTLLALVPHRPARRDAEKPVLLSRPT
jgi:MFS family permease